MSNTPVPETEQAQLPQADVVTYQERRRRRISRRPRNLVLVHDNELVPTGRDVEDMALAHMRTAIV